MQIRSGVAALFLIPASLLAQNSKHSDAITDLTKDSAFYPRYQVPVRNIHTLTAGSHESGQDLEGVRLRAVISPEGKVLLAEAVSGPTAYYAEAERIERTRRFEPIRRHGIPVTARIKDRVTLLPPERWQAQHVAFPENIDLRLVTMRMNRGGCYGTCPIYTITVHGNGLVEYDGASYVKLKGRFNSRISPEAVLRLVQLFRSVDFFSTEDEYVASITDLPTVGLDLTIGQQTKHVTDYFGETQGMPEGVTDIIVEMDRETNAVQWTKPYGRRGRD